jgi:tetrahydromethanopterin S-methyltransferase subunit F
MAEIKPLVNDREEDEEIVRIREAIERLEYRIQILQRAAGLDEATDN